MMTHCTFRMYRSADSTLRKYVEMNLERTWNSFEVISEAANKEHSLEKAMDKMLHEWDEVKTIIIVFCCMLCVYE